MKKTITTLMLIIAITAHLVDAQAANSTPINRVDFTNLGDGDNWLDQQNWANHSGPTTNDAARIRNGSTARLTTEETIAAIQPGADGPGKLIIDGGKLNVTGLGKGAWSTVGYNDKGSLTIENKGSLRVETWLSIGKTGYGELIVKEGTVRVKNIFFHHIDQTIPQDYLASRTTLYPGGLLDVDQIILNAGVMDIAGGTLIIRRQALPVIASYVNDGRMIAMGGETGWKIQADFDAGTQCTTVVAVPGDEQDPISVEGQSSDPASFAQSRLLKFTNRSGSGYWETPSNWTDNSIPGADDVALFNSGETAILTTSATVLAIRPGKEGPGGLIIDGGHLNVTGEGGGDWSIIGYDHDGSLTVQNRGSVTFTGWLSIGRLGAGVLTIHDGTVRIEGKFYHHNNATGADKNVATRTTLHPGGLLDVDYIDLEAGVMDIAGGMLIVRRHPLSVLQEYIANGRIIAMGGEAGWKIQASQDDSTGWIMVIAIPDGSPPTDKQKPVDKRKPVSVGMRTPNLYHNLQPVI